MTDEEEYEDVDAPPTLTPAYAITGKVSRDKHPDFPDDDTVTNLDLYVEVILGEGEDDIMRAILPIVMKNKLADYLGLQPESDNE